VSAFCAFRGSKYIIQFLEFAGLQNIVSLASINIYGDHKSYDLAPALFTEFEFLWACVVLHACALAFVGFFFARGSRA